jgi:hypothetical protein
VHKNVQFQVRVRPDFVPLILKAIEQSGMHRWEYLEKIVSDLIGEDGWRAIPDNPPNRKGMYHDYWTKYARVPFIVTVDGIALLNRARRNSGHNSLSSFLRASLVAKVCDDLGINPDRVPPMRRKEKGMGFGV